MKSTIFLMLAIGVLITTTSHSATFLDEICEKQKCSSSFNEYKIGNISITTDFYGPVADESTNEIDKFYSKLIHRAHIKVKRENKTIWEYNEILEAHGGQVGLSEGVPTPDKKKIIFHVSGNYSNKLIIIFSDGSVEIIDGTQNYTLEESGRFLFTSLVEDTPLGFQIYDLEKKRVAFKTDKFIISWSNKNDGIYELKEELWEEGNFFKYYLLTISTNGITIKQRL